MSIQAKIALLSAVAILAIVSLAAMTSIVRGEFSESADQLYDKAFVGVHYAHIVEVKFVRFEAARQGLRPPFRSGRDIEAVRDILGDIDVAIERAPNDRVRRLASATRAEIAGLTQTPGAGAPAVSLASVDRDLSHLVQRFADAALDMRTAVDDKVAQSTPPILLAVGLALLLGAGGALLLVFNITPPLRRAARLIEADGDFATADNGLLLRRRDEIGAVARALANSRERLRDTLLTLEERVHARTAELQRAKEEAEAANRSKSLFLANVSHEIRTPLNGVLGMAQAMSNDQLAPHQNERLKIIRHSGEALLEILNDILDLSKIEAGKLELEAIEFDLEGMTAGVRSAFTHLANAKDLRFVLDAEAAQGLYRGDPVRVRQILYNLISNAVKFTEAGSVEVAILRTEDGLRIVVEDTGIGMSPEVVGKLFAKFSQADASTTRRFGGTGLGLSICLHLTELMGGRIGAVSQFGVGSRFTVELPLPCVTSARAAAGEQPVDDAEPEAAAVGELRVLAAEDNLVNQLVLKTLLAQIGVEPVMVENGLLAVEACRARAFDLILMDIQMPEMDGLHATRAIRELEAATGRARTPIIALTANVMAHQIELYRGMGMDGHVAKPIDAARLFEALAEQVERLECADAA